MRAMKLVAVILLCFLTACSARTGLADNGGTHKIPPGSYEKGDAERIIRVTDINGGEIRSFTQTELSGLMAEHAYVYSTINNWPTTRFYAAEGYSAADILAAAGALDNAQTVTFRGGDGYEVSLTREQLLSEQYYFPHAGESAEGAEPVIPIIALRWREGSEDLGDIRDEVPCLIIGQRNAFEQTNPAFVEDVCEIIVDNGPCGAWQKAGTFPEPGYIETGESVKLQHPDIGRVKLYYTLDGTDPTPLSALYNPSTYRPELTVPIKIAEPVVIKVIVCGYGKSDSETAVFEFFPSGEQGG